MHRLGLPECQPRDTQRNPGSSQGRLVYPDSYTLHRQYISTEVLKNSLNLINNALISLVTAAFSGKIIFFPDELNILASI